MLSTTNFAIKLIVLLSSAFLILGGIEFRKPHRVAKLTGLAWVRFSLGFASLSYSLFTMQGTWHLPNSQKPWALISSSGGVAVFFMVLGCSMITHVSFIKEAENTERNARALSNIQVSEAVWPPAPKREEPGTESAGLLGESRSATEEKPNADGI